MDFTNAQASMFRHFFSSSKIARNRKNRARKKECRRCGVTRTDNKGREETFPRNVFTILQWELTVSKSERWKKFKRGLESFAAEDSAFQRDFRLHHHPEGDSSVLKCRRGCHGNNTKNNDPDARRCIGVECIQVTFDIT